MGKYKNCWAQGEEHEEAEKLMNFLVDEELVLVDREGPEWIAENQESFPVSLFLWITSSAVSAWCFLPQDPSNDSIKLTFGWPHAKLPPISSVPFASTSLRGGRAGLTGITESGFCSGIICP